MIRTFCLCLVSIATLSACAINPISIFQPYTTEAAKYKNALATDNPDSALTALNGKTGGADKLLYLSERGRLYQVYGQFDASKADFESAIQAYIDREEGARLKATDLAADSASLLTNDNAMPYRGYAFERIFLHQFQAFNYLASNDISGAGVELRRASLEQRNLELENEKAIAAAEEDASENNVQLPDMTNIPQLQGMSQVVGDVKSSFQNAYTFYTSAVIWEALGERNAALVDYKKALAINPSSTMLQQDVKRLDRGRARTDTAALVVLYEDGFIPARQAFSLTVPDAYNNNVYSIAFPFYATENWYRPTSLRVTLDADHQSDTEMIANFGAMAVRSLKEKIPAMLVRQILRARVKHEMQKQAEKADPLAGFAATLYNIASERADVRNWLTLPNNAQALRLEAPGGEYNVQLQTLAGTNTVPVSLANGRLTILRVFNFNNQLKMQTYQL